MGEDPEKRPMSSTGVYPVQVAPTSAYTPPGSRKIALLIPLLVAVNVAMFFITMYINNCPHNTPYDTCVAKFLRRLSFQPLSENPLLGPSSDTLQKLGALDVNKVAHEHQGWRLITCIWLHAGVIHIVVNMLSLLFIGIKLEQEFGFLRIGVVYLISGLGGSLLSALFLKNSISVGASGALFGLLGAMLSELITNWTMYSNKCAAFMTLFLVVAINLAIGILPHVDNFAHIGGFISGFLAGFVLLLKPQVGDMPFGNEVGYPFRRKHRLYQYILCVIALIFLIVGFSIAMVMVLRGVDGNKKCSWCHYLSCVPTSKWKCNNT
ncbi:hypothetical protein L7F22_046038 [Adiantum nelumboides]|nr:hypothetical protein [Adiantum nelumboides]